MPGPLARFAPAFVLASRCQATADPVIAKALGIGRASVCLQGAISGNLAGAAALPYQPVARRHCRDVRPPLSIMRRVAGFSLVLGHRHAGSLICASTEREVEQVRIGRWPQRRTGDRARWGQQRLIAIGALIADERQS
jgi:hypothetical protein